MFQILTFGFGKVLGLLAAEIWYPSVRLLDLVDRMKLTAQSRAY
jgi:hypothetical protein